MQNCHCCPLHQLLRGRAGSGSTQRAPHTSGCLGRALTSGVSGHSGCNQNNNKKKQCKTCRLGLPQSCSGPQKQRGSCGCCATSIATAASGCTAQQPQGYGAELQSSSRAAKNMNVGIPRGRAGGQQAADGQRHPAPDTPRPHHTAALGFKQHTLHPAISRTPFTAEAMHHMLSYVNNASKQSHNNYSVHTEQQTLIKLNRKQCSKEKHAKGLVPLVTAT